MIELAFPSGFLHALRQRLLAESPCEAGAILLAGWTRGRDSIRLLVREAVHVPSTIYSNQSSLSLTIPPGFIAPVLKRARTESFSLVLTHTHPFAENETGFSTVDDNGECILMPSIHARAPDKPHGALVLSQRGHEARVWMDPSGPPAFVDRVSEIGRDLQVFYRTGSGHQWTAAAAFDRNVRAFGAVGQRRLEQMRFAVVGLGGTGSIVAQELAHLGAKQIVLVDYDTVETTNLNRLVGTTPDSVGRPKVHVAAEHLTRISPGIRIEPIVGDVRFNREALRLVQSDLVFCCTDSHGSRAVLNQLAYQYLIPTIDMGVRVDTKSGTVTGITGRVQMLAPGLPCLVCRGFLDPGEVRRDLMTEADRQRDPYIVGDVEPQPAVISLNGTVSSLAVTMMLAAVTGLPSETRYQLLIGTSGTVRTVAAPPVPDCIVCSLRGAFARGDAWQLPGRP